MSNYSKQSTSFTRGGMSGILLFALLVWSFPLNLPAQDSRQLTRDESTKRGISRIALVIGNGDYEHTTKLDNPVNDATDMAQALKELGFEVITGTNQNRLQMRNLIRDFGSRLTDTKGVGLFFYAGHGLAVSGDNYLVPVDADIKAEDEIADLAVSMNFLLGKMAAAQNGFNMVILDACRNNPFARSWRNYRDIGDKGGLVRVNAPTGTLIAYATKPGEVASDGSGRNGLYTEALLKQMRVKDVDVTKMLQKVRAEVLKNSDNKQVPFDESSLVGDFYFAGKSGDTVTNTNPNPTPAKADRIDGERAFWESIKGSADPEDFEFYLKKYPDGEFSPVAENSLRRLRKTKTPAGKVDADSQAKKTEETKSSNSALPAGSQKEVGTYRFNGIDIVVKIEDGKLMMVAPGQPSAILENVEGRKYRPLNEGEGKFITFNDTGAVIEDSGNRFILSRLATTRPVNVENPSAGTVQKDSMGISFAYIPPGTFQMGNDSSYFDDQRPAHQVTITSGFWIGIYEVTQEQWTRLMGNNPSLSSNNCGQCPVEYVTWEDAQGFIRQLNSQTNDGSRYRLPTEAEWEYAARAGTTGDYSGNLESVAWYQRNAGDKELTGDISYKRMTKNNNRSHPVGQKSANSWGLYDMHGNVAEWVEDWFGRYPIGPVTDPKGPTSGSERVYRGGSYFQDGLFLQSATRNKDKPDYKISFLGLRLVRTFN